MPLPFQLIVQSAPELAWPWMSESDTKNMYQRYFIAYLLRFFVLHFPIDLFAVQGQVYVVIEQKLGLPEKSLLLWLRDVRGYSMLGK